MTPMARTLGVSSNLVRNGYIFLYGVKPETPLRAGEIVGESREVIICRCPSQFTQCCTFGTGEGDSLPSIPHKIKSRASTLSSARF